MSALHIVTNRQWMVDELSHNTLFPVEHSLGLDIPRHSSDDLWWIPQGIANRFIASGVKFSFSAPGPSWLPGIPAKLLQRKVQVITAGNLYTFSNTKRFWKFAEAKVDFMLAGEYTTQELISLLKVNKIPDDSLLQFSTVVDIKNEFRFFIVDGKITAYSAYLNRESGQETIYYDANFTNPFDLDEAYSFAASVAPVLDSPRGYALDVASLRDGNFIVLEANPAWCSAWYGSEIDGVVRSIEASHNDSKKWFYKPDPLLVKKYSKMVSLKWQ